MSKNTRDVSIVLIAGICFCFAVYRITEPGCTLTLKCTETGLTEASLQCA